VEKGRVDGEGVEKEGSSGKGRQRGGEVVEKGRGGEVVEKGREEMGRGGGKRYYHIIL
jgi:hypothetical protein